MIKQTLMPSDVNEKKEILESFNTSVSCSLNLARMILRLLLLMV